MSCQPRSEAGWQSRTTAPGANAGTCDNHSGVSSMVSNLTWKPWRVRCSCQLPAAARALRQEQHRPGTAPECRRGPGLVHHRRQPEMERRSSLLGSRRLDSNVSPVQLDQLATDRQPDPESAISPRHRPIRLAKLVKDRGLLLRRNAQTGIDHAHGDTGVGLRHGQSDKSVRSELDRIRHEVEYHLLQPGGVLQRSPEVAPESRPANPTPCRRAISSPTSATALSVSVRSSGRLVSLSNPIWLRARSRTSRTRLPRCCELR